MRGFGTLKVCPKCRGDKFSTSWQPAEYYVATTYKSKTSEECMKIQCDRCGYAEYEQPADYIEQPKCFLDIDVFRLKELDNKEEDDK